MNHEMEGVSYHYDAGGGIDGEWCTDSQATNR